MRVCVNTVCVNNTVCIVCVKCVCVNCVCVNCVCVKKAGTAEKAATGFHYQPLGCLKV